MLIVWNVITSEELFTVPHSASSVAFSPDGTRIVVGGVNNLRVVDAENGEELLDFEHDIVVQSVAFSPDGTRILSGEFNDPPKLWDAASGTRLLTLRGQEMGALSVAFCPTGRRIISAGIDNTVKIWDAGQLSGGDQD